MAIINKPVVEEGLELPVQTVMVDKGLFYTKKPYEKIIKNTLQNIQENKASLNSKELSEMYGIYYNAFAGYLRSGALCCRKMGKDGFPEIVINITDKAYKIRESVLYGILREQAEYLIHPYEDTSASYLEDKPFNILVKQEGEDTLEITKGKKKKPEKDVDIIQTNLEQNHTDIQALEKLNADHQKELNDIKNQYDSQISTLKNKYGEQEKAHKLLQRKVAYEEAEAKKYKYDPNYDHYYSDELPAIIKSIEFTHTDLLVKSFCMVMCCIGIVLSFLFVF